MKNSDLLVLVKKLNQVPATNAVISIVEMAFISKGTISATDIETTIIVDAEINKDAVGYIPRKKLQQILTKLDKSKEIDFESDDSDRLHILVDGARKFSFSESIKPDDWIKEEQYYDWTKDKMTSEDVALALKALPFVTTDELRPAMTGVCFDKNHIVATDGHRLAFFKTEEERSLPFILPSISTKILDPKKEYDMAFDKNKNRVQLSYPGFKMQARVIDERYPDWENVVPKDNPIVALFPISEFAKVVDLSLLTANNSTHQVEMTLDHTTASVTIHTEDLDFDHEFTDQVKYTHVQGEGIRIGFNGKLMLDLLKKIESDDKVFKISLSAPNRAMVLDDEYLIMPVMLSNNV